MWDEADTRQLQSTLRFTFDAKIIFEKSIGFWFSKFYPYNYDIIENKIKDDKNADYSFAPNLLPLKHPYTFKLNKFVKLNESFEVLEKNPQVITLWS